MWTSRLIPIVTLEYQLFIKCFKCAFGTPKMEYLGNIVI